MELLIKENSCMAKLAAKKLGAESVAITLGRTIHLYHVSKDDFLKDEKWVRHEKCHIEQYKKYGFFNFIVRYLWESIKVGYYHNKFEAEARKAEERT